MKSESFGRPPPPSRPLCTPLQFYFIFGQKGNFAIRYAALVSAAARSLLQVVVDDVADVHRYSPLSSRLTALLLHVIVIGWLWLLVARFFFF